MEELIEKRRKAMQIGSSVRDGRELHEDMDVLEVFDSKSCGVGQIC